MKNGFRIRCSSGTIGIRPAADRRIDARCRGLHARHRRVLQIAWTYEIEIRKQHGGAGRRHRAVAQPFMRGQNNALLEGLKSLGCGIKSVDGFTLVTLPDEYDEFVFEQLGEWLYLGTTLLTPEDLEASGYTAALDRFLLELQHRSLGCHFSYDGSGFLTIGTELYLNQQNSEEVLQTMEQIAFVIDTCLPLCDRVLETGELPADKEIDSAFGVSEKLH
jgi:hypothetical protein